MGGSYKPPKEPNPAGLEEEQFSTATEALPVPYLAGTRKVSLRWISSVYNLFSQNAPEERPAKK
jgi:hypothetical protein